MRHLTYTNHTSDTNHNTYTNHTPDSNCDTYTNHTPDTIPMSSVTAPLTLTEEFNALTALITTSLTLIFTLPLTNPVTNTYPKPLKMTHTSPLILTFSVIGKWCDYCRGLGAGYAGYDTG